MTAIDNVNDTLSKIKKEDIEQIMIFMVKFLRHFGDFMIGVGNLEKEHGDIMKDLPDLMTNPQFLKNLVSKVPPKTLGGFVKVLFEFNALRSKLDNIHEMSADGKIKVGALLKQLSQDIEVLMKEEVDE